MAISARSFSCLRLCLASPLNSAAERADAQAQKHVSTPTLDTLREPATAPRPISLIPMAAPIVLPSTAEDNSFFFPFDF